MKKDDKHYFLSAIIITATIITAISFWLCFLEIATYYAKKQNYPPTITDDSFVNESSKEDSSTTSDIIPSNVSNKSTDTIEKKETPVVINIPIELNSLDAIEKKSTPIVINVPINLSSTKVIERKNTPITINVPIKMNSISEIEKRETPIVIGVPIDFKKEKPIKIPDIPIITEPTVSVSLPNTPIITEPTISVSLPNTPLIEKPTLTFIPDTPLFMEPDIEKKDLFIPIIPPKADDDDFWSDFYMEGDELTLEDGYYYMDYYINDDYYGVIDVLIENGECSINYQTLKSTISPMLTKSATRRIFSTEYVYIPLKTLKELGVDSLLDTINYKVSLYISPVDMPLRIISVKGKNIGVRNSLPISGAIDSTKQNIYLKSSYNTSLRGEFASNRDPYFSLSLNADNTLNIFDWIIKFNYSMHYSTTSPFSLSYSMPYVYHDFRNKGLRLSLGAISTDLLSPTGNVLGFSLERAYAYGDITPKQVVTETFSLEEESIVTVTNKGTTNYSKTLSPGIYRFIDFVLYENMNEIYITVTPLNGGETKEYYYRFPWTSSLLPPKEVMFKVSGSVGYNRSPKFRFIANDWALSATVSAGLNRSVTLSSSAAFSTTPNGNDLNHNLKLNFNLIQATSNNPIYYNLNLGFSNSFVPSIYFRISKSFSIKSTPLSSISMSLSYDTLGKVTDKKASLSFSSSFSGKVFNIPWSLGGTGGMSINNKAISSYSYSIYSSLSFPFIKNVNLSLSLTLNGSNTSLPKLYGRIYSTISFGKGGSLSLSESPTDTSISYSNNINSYGLSASSSLPSLLTPREFLNKDNYSLSFGLSKGFNPISLSLNGGITSKSSSFSLTFGTQSLIAGNMILFSANIPDKVLLIKNDKTLKNGIFEGGTVGSSTIKKLPFALGGHYYSAASNESTAMVYFTDNDSSFSSTQAWPVNISGDGIFLVKLKGNVTYAVFGEVDGFYNDSSPVYKLDIIDNEVRILGEDEEQYLFTDGEGNFNLSDLKPGLYGFDSKIDNEWILNVFSIDENMELNKINHITVTQNNISYPAPYSRVNYYSFDRAYTSDEYWALFFGEVI